MFDNQPLIYTIKGEAAIMKLDNAVDSDSDVDSVPNIGSNDSSYLNAQSLDGTDQVIQETSGGGGGGGLMHSSSVLAPAQNGLVDGRHYSPLYSEGEMILGNEFTKGLQTFKNWRGQWKSFIDWKPNLYNASYYDDVTDKNITKYIGDGGSFKSIFYERNNTLIGDGWQFTQRPSRVFVYNWDTDDKSYIQNVQVPENFTLNEELQRVRYKNIFPDTDFYAGYNGSMFKEVIRAKKTYDQYPSDPYPDNKTFMILETRILDFNIDLWDDDGNITDSKDIEGILKFKDKVTQEIIAYLPLGTAWALFVDSQNHSTNVKFRLEKVGGEWRFYCGINYTLFTHPQRTGDVYIDPTWIVGKGGDSWKDCVFWQTMENETTGYAQLYPFNVTGNVTSPIKEAMKNWIKIQYQGDLPSGTNISIYYNSSRDSGITDPYEMQLVTDLAQPNVNYTLPVQEKYGSWRLILNTDDSSYSSLVHNLTLFNDPPNDDDFTYYKEIEINAAKVSGSGSHSNFPVLIYLPSDSDLASDAQNDGDDIAFSNDTAWLDHENEFFNSSDGELVAWVRILSLSTSSNTTIRMYYGNDTMGSQQNPTGVWASGLYEGVWHTAETSGNCLDSTSYGTDGTFTIGVAQAQSGQIGYAYDFDGSGNMVIFGNPVHLHPGSGSMTVSIWLNFDTTTGQDQKPLFYGGPVGSFAGYSFHGGVNLDDIDLHCSDGTTTRAKYNGGSITQDQWDRFTLIIDRSADTLRAFKNGVEEGSGTDISMLGDINNSVVYRWSKSNGKFDGLIDEVHISRGIRSADWLVTIYNSQNDPDSFFDIGSEQSVTPPNYRLEWEHQCQNVPYTTMDSFNLTIYGISSDSEDFEIQLWNITASDWINTSQFIEQTETWYNFSIDNYSGVIDSNITWRYLDNITSSDTTQGSLRIDYAGIVYWNYSINLIEATLSLPSYDATLDDWQDYLENPLEINVSSLYDFDIEIRGVDGSGNPVSNGYIRFDIDSNPAGGTNLTTSYQVLFNDQTAGQDLELTFWLFFAYPRLGGNEGTTFTMTLYIRIGKA